MKNVGTKEIDLEEYRLRKLEFNDCEEMFNGWCNDPLVTRYLPWDIHGTIDVTKELLDFWIKEYDKIDTYRWIVEDKINHKLIGTVDVVNIDNTNKVMELGCCYKREYWGNGVGSLVLNAVIKYLFDNTDVELITAKHVEPNIGSGKIMQKCGMKYDGTLRSRFIDKETKQRLGQVCYSITKVEFNTSKN